jgi:Flp pilus assembly protein TadG
VTTRRRFRLSLGSRRGQSAIELGLMIPWIVVAFMALLDFGFCIYGMIATENAARTIAAWGTATHTNAQNIGSETSTLCNYAIGALQYAPNVGTSVSSCTGASPIRVSATYNASGSDSSPTLTVAVTYTVTLMAVPGVSPSSLAITRTVELPVRN